MDVVGHEGLDEIRSARHHDRHHAWAIPREHGDGIGGTAIHRTAD